MDFIQQIFEKHIKQKRFTNGKKMSHKNQVTGTLLFNWVVWEIITTYEAYHY